MTALHKIGGGLVFALAVLTFLICITGALGAWYMKATVDEASLAAIDTVLGYIELATRTIDDVDARLSDAEQSVAAVRSGVAGLGEGGRDGPAARALQRIAADDLLPRVEGLAAGAERLRSGLAGLNQTIEQLNRMPFVSLPEVGDELAALDERLAAAGAQATELRSAVASVDGARLLAAADRVDAGLTGARAALGSVAQRLGRAEAVLGDISASLTFWSTVSTSVLTVFLLIFAAGQASLAAHAWGWMRGERAAAAAPGRPGGAAGRP